MTGPCRFGVRCGPAPHLLWVVCRDGHEQTVRACTCHAQQVLTDRQPNCPTCDAPAGWVILCPPCRDGLHRTCRAWTGARLAMADLPMWDPNLHCACTCDPNMPVIGGAGQARDLTN